MEFFNHIRQFGLICLANINRNDNYTLHVMVFRFRLKVLSFFQGEDLGEVEYEKSENHFSFCVEQKSQCESVLICGLFKVRQQDEISENVR